MYQVFVDTRGVRHQAFVSVRVGGLLKSLDGAIRRAKAKGGYVTDLSRRIVWCR